MKSLVSFSVELDKPWLLSLHRLLQLSYSLEGRSPWDPAADKAKAYYPLKLILCKLLTGRQCISQMGAFIIRQHYVFNTVREQSWELLNILVELRQVHPINTAISLQPWMLPLIPGLTVLCVVFKSHSFCSWLPLCSCRKRQGLEGQLSPWAKALGEPWLDTWLGLQISCL